MFESKLAGVLNTVLGSYVHGISTDDLKVAVFKGDVVLSNMRLKVEALNALGLPFKVRSGVVGKLTLRVPWRTLGKSPVIVLIEDLHVVAGFADGDNGEGEVDAEETNKLAEAARAAATRDAVDAGELLWLLGGDTDGTAVTKANEQTTSSSTGSDGYFAGMLDTILGNLEVTVRRIHLRLEGELGEATDAAGKKHESASPDSFAFGVTLEAMELHTVDANGDQIFSKQGLAERMRKAATLTRLAVYFDVGAASLRPATAKSWEDVTPDQLIAVMRVGVTGAHKCDADASKVTTQTTCRNFLLAPVSASATYERRGPKDLFDPSVPAQRIFLKIDAIETRVCSSHLRAAFHAASRVERDARRAPHAHLRPKSSVNGSSRDWWRFAIDAVILERRRKGNGTAVPLRIDRVLDAMRQRRAYVDLYVKYVKGAWRDRPKGNAASGRSWFSSRRRDAGQTKRWPPPLAVGAAPALDAIEQKLPPNVCVLFRALAHAQVRRELGDEDATARGEAEDTQTDKQSSGGGYFGGWFSSSKPTGDGPGGATSEPVTTTDSDMSDDDWQNLQRAFDVEGHASAAAAAASLSAEHENALASEFLLVLGAASMAFVDDEVVEVANTGHNREVLRAGLVGFVAGSRAFGGTRADHRTTVDAMEIDASGAAMARVSGDDATVSRNGSKNGTSPLRGSVAADAVAQRLWCDDDDDVFYDDDDEEDTRGNETAPREALRVRFLNKPLGGEFAPDIDVGLILAPAHVVALRAPIDRLLENLSRHKPAQLQEQEEMLRRAVTEGARAGALAARERLTASLADRAVVNVSVVIHAPRIAVPSFRFGEDLETHADAADTVRDDPDSATLILDLGRFRLDSCCATELGADPATEKAFNAFRVSLTDVSVALASGVWDPSRTWQTATLTDVTPIIPSVSARATLMQALLPVPNVPSVQTTFHADAVRVALSPKRVKQLLAVAANVSSSSSSSSSSVDDSRTGMDVSLDHSDDSLIDYTDDDREDGTTHGEVLVVSLGRLRWTPCRLRVRLDGETQRLLEVFGVGAAYSKRLTPSLLLENGGALRVSSDAAGRPRVIAVCATAAAVDATAAATKQKTRDPSCLRALVERSPAVGGVVLVCFGSAEVATRFREGVNAAARGATQQSVVPSSLGFPKTMDADSSPQASNSFALVATLAELSVVVAVEVDAEFLVAAAPKNENNSSTSLDESFEDADEDNWWCSVFDSATERVLTRITLAGVQATTSVGDDGTNADVALAAFDVFDEFSTKGDDRTTTLLRLSAASKSENASNIDHTATTANGVFHLSYVSIPASSPKYAGVDVDLDLVVGALCVSARRPTLAALAAIPGLLISSEDTQSTRARHTGNSGAAHTPGTVSPSLVSLETGKTRVATRIKARVDAFRLALMLDDADELFQLRDDTNTTAPGCVADARINGLCAELVLFPSTMRASANLGSLAVVDPRLPVGHPCRVVVRAADESGLTTNETETETDRTEKPLVSVSWETFDPDEAPDGADASVFARVNSLRAVYLSRFVSECSSFVDGYVEAAGTSGDTRGTEGEGVLGQETNDPKPKPKPKPQTQNSAPSKIRIDVALAAPVIVVPRGTHDFGCSVEVDMGSLSAKNAFVVRDTTNGLHEELDRTEVTLRGVNVAIVFRDGDESSSSFQKAPLAKDPVGATAIVERRLCFKTGMDGRTDGTDGNDTPSTVVRASLAPAHVTLSAADFKRLAGCFSENAKERPAAIAVPRNPATWRLAVPTTRRVLVLIPPRKSVSGVPTRAVPKALDDDTMDTDSQSTDTITTRFTFTAQLASVAVFRGDDRREPLARLSVGEFVVDAATTEGGEVLADVSIGSFSLSDMRGGRNRPVAGGGNGVDTTDDDSSATEFALPLLRLRASSSATTTTAAATMQRFTIEVDPTFLLDVGRVFVPSLAGGGGESPEDVLPHDTHLLNGEVYQVPFGKNLELHPTSRLLADGQDGGVYELDGNGARVFVANNNNSETSENAPLIFVGPNCTLRLRNTRVEIEAGSDEDARAVWANITALAPGARLIAEKEDGVFFVPVAAARRGGRNAGAPGFVSDGARASQKSPSVSKSSKSSKSSYSLRAVRLTLRVLGGEVESENDPQDALTLDFGIDASADLATRDVDGGCTEAQARVVRLRADVNGAATLAPLDVVARYTWRVDENGTHSQDARLTLAASPVSLALSTDRIATVARVTTRLAAAAARAPIMEGHAFRQTWSSTSVSGKSPGTSTETLWNALPLEQGASGTKAGAGAWSTWRPHPPPGYASLGDVAGDCGPDVPPSVSSFLIRDSPAFTAAPVRFEKVETLSHVKSNLVIWRPIPPPGFVALGVACAFADAPPPPLDAMRCVRKELVCAAVGVSGRAGAGEGAPALWVVANAARTVVPPFETSLFDLRLPTGLPGDPGSVSRRLDTDAKNATDDNTDDDTSGNANATNASFPSSTVTHALDSKTVVDFHRVWWSFNAGAASELSVWRPKCAPGWVSLGDVVVAALEPPASSVIFRVSSSNETENPTNERESSHPPLAPPVAYERVWRDTGWRARGKRVGTLSFWRPVPSHGYVACGHVTSNTHAPPPIGVVFCLRDDLAMQVPLSAMGGSSYQTRGRRKFQKSKSKPSDNSCFWSPEGAAFKLGRDPLRVWKPRAPASLFPGDDEIDETGWLSLGAFVAVAGDAAANNHAAPTAFAPRASTPFSCFTGTESPKNATTLVARLERVDATLFVERGDMSHGDASSPLAKVSLRAVSLDARSATSGEANATLLATVSASHFNQRVAHWEPVVEPWEVAARWEVRGPCSPGALVGHQNGSSGSPVNGSNVSPESRPVGSTFRVEGASPLRLVTTRAFAEDLSRAAGASVSSVGTQSDAAADSNSCKKDVIENSTALKNALGVPLFWRASHGGDLVSVLPGDALPHVGFTSSDAGAKGGTDVETTETHQKPVKEKGADDTDEPTFLRVDVLETRGGQPFDTVVFSLKNGDSCSIAPSRVSGGTTGSVILDVGEWRALVRRNGRASSSLSLGVALKPSLLASRRKTDDDDDAAPFSASVKIPANDLFAASVTHETWYPHAGGVWVATGDQGQDKQVRIRVRLVEGLDLRPVGSAKNEKTEPSRKPAEIENENETVAHDENALETQDGDEMKVDHTMLDNSRLILRRVRALDMSWWSKNSGADDFSAWTPNAPSGWAMLGTTIVASLLAPTEVLVAPAPWLLVAADTSCTKSTAGETTPHAKASLNSETKPPTAPALGFHPPAFRDGGSRLRKNLTTGTFAVWRPIAPDGYVSVGCVVTGSHLAPDPLKIACVRADLAQLATPAPAPLWTTFGGESKLGNGKLSVYRSGVAFGAGWLPVVDGNAGVFIDAHELKWDAVSGAKVLENESDSDMQAPNGPSFALSRDGPWTNVSSSALGATSASATFLGPNGAVVVVDRTDGCVRAPACLVARDVPFVLEARLVRLTDRNLDEASHAAVNNTKTSPLVEVYESERFFPIAGWLPPKSPFDEFFTARYGDVRGGNSTSHFADQPLPEGWRWVGPWQVDRDHDVDEKGWAFGVTWVTRWPPPRGSHKRGICATRRRRWTRRRALIGDSNASSLQSPLQAGDDALLAWRGELGRDGLAQKNACALPLGCGEVSVGGDATVGLDLRVLGETETDGSGGVWAFDFDAQSSSSGLVPPTAAWPVPVGRLGGAAGKGPWLASCSCATNSKCDGDSKETTVRFVSVSLEQDTDVSSAVGVDALREAVAYRLVARAPVVLTNATPTTLQFVLVRDVDGGVAATGVALPGVATSIFHADPRVPSRLELVPVGSDGKAMGRCMQAVGLFGDARLDSGRNKEQPKAPSELLVSLFATGGDVSTPPTNLLRFVVAINKADGDLRNRGLPAGRPGAPAALVVDIRAVLVVANGCPFALQISAAQTASANDAFVAPGAQTVAATPESGLRQTFTNKGKGSDSTAKNAQFGGALALTPRDLWIATPGGVSTKVTLAPGAAPTLFAVTTRGGDVLELAVSADAWAPHGVSAAALRPTLRAVVSPTLSILNLSNCTVNVVAQDRGVGALPQSLAPGEGPTCVTRGFSVKDKKGGASDDAALAFSFSSARAEKKENKTDEFPATPFASVAAIECSGGAGALLLLPGASHLHKSAATLRATVERAGDGCRLLVLRGGDGAAAAAVGNARVCNKSSETVWVRQTRHVNSTDKETGGVNSTGWIPTSAWAEVGKGACVAWAMQDRSVFETAEGTTKLTKKLSERSASKFAGDADENEEEKEEEEDEFEKLDQENTASTQNGFVEICIGADPEIKSNQDQARVVVSVPADIARGGDKIRQEKALSGSGSDTDNSEPVAVLRFGADNSDAVAIAVRMRWDGGIVSLTMVPAGVGDGGDEHKKTPTLLDKREPKLEPKNLRARAALSPESVFQLSLPSASLSLVDGHDEILFISADGVEFRSGVGLGVEGGSQANTLVVAAAQIDDPRFGCAFPIVLWHDPNRGPLLRATLSSIAPSSVGVGSSDTSDTQHDIATELGAPKTGNAETRYPAACVTAAPGGVHCKIHESLVWRLVAFVGAFSSAGGQPGIHGTDGTTDARTTLKPAIATAKKVDPPMRVDMFRLSPLLAKITFKPSTGRRPPSVGPALAATLSMLHLDRLRFEVREYRFGGGRLLRASDLLVNVTNHCKREATKQILAVLASVNHLSNVAGTLERAGDTIRGISGSLNRDGKDKDNSDDGDDDTYESSPRRSGLGDAMHDLTGGRKNVVTQTLVGSGELVGGVLGGVGGIFTKSIAGFRKSGLSGFADGAARGVVGLGTSTAAGAVGFAARVVEGVEATVGGVQDGVGGVLSLSDAAAFAAATPRRAPLAVRGDGVIRCFSESDSEGARLLRVVAFPNTVTKQNVQDTLNPLNLGNTLGNFNAPQRKPFNGDRFEAVFDFGDPPPKKTTLLLSHRRVGLLSTNEETVEWVLLLAEVASVSIDSDDDTHVTVQARSADGSVSRTVRCGSREKASDVARRIRQVWRTARTAATRGAEGGVRGGGVF